MWKPTGVWPGTQGTSCGAEDWTDEGAKRLQDIMKGRSLPVWNGPPHPRFVPEWTSDTIDLCNEVIKNTQQELSLSGKDHDAWKAKRKEEQRQVLQQGLPMQNWGRQRQGWLDRKAIWDRPCRIGAVGSMVIKIKGMKLKVDSQGWVDRMGAAHSVRLALLRGAQEADGLRMSILDVVCSKTEVEMTGPGGANGPEKITCTFYIRFPAFVGLVAHEQWIPRISVSEICACPVEAYLFFGDGKERMYSGYHYQHQAGWDIKVDGVVPSGAGVDSVMLDRNANYNPDSKEAQSVNDLAIKPLPGVSPQEGGRRFRLG